MGNHEGNISGQAMSFARESRDYYKNIKRRCTQGWVYYNGHADEFLNTLRGL
jgi:hypothetical protein